MAIIKIINRNKYIYPRDMEKYMPENMVIDILEIYQKLSFNIIDHAKTPLDTMLSTCPVPNLSMDALSFKSKFARHFSSITSSNV
jgi:hypothetical protein